MSSPIRHEAQQRADEIAIFQAELVRLEGEGVLRLAAAQREAVRSLTLTVGIETRDASGYFTKVAGSVLVCSGTSR